MLHGKINTGKRLAALALCGLFALQAPAVPAMAAETLTVQDQGFYRIDGTKIEGAVAKGVTISKYQNQAGPIDWDAMKADGVTFAMIRVGYLNDLDPYFKENMEGAISHGIRVGVFLYSMALDEETARQEAQYVLEQIRGYKISYPVAYDVESKYLLDNGKTPQELANQTNVFCKAIAGTGRSGSLPRRVPWQASLAMSASRLLSMIIRSWRQAIQEVEPTLQDLLQAGARV